MEKEVSILVLGCGERGKKLSKGFFILEVIGIDVGSKVWKIGCA